MPKLKGANTQMAIFVLVGICTLGPFNGLNALGGGGLRDHMLATRLNVVYAVSLAGFGWFAGALFNAYGARKVATAGGLCYATYVATLLCVTFFNFSPHWAYPCGVVVGLGASLIWSSFGALSIRYPVLKKQGRSFAVMWGALNSGGFLCGLLALITNIQSSGGEASHWSYLVLQGLTLLGCLIAVIFLRHQKKVIREDGQSAGIGEHHLQIKEALKLFTDPSLILLWPAFMVPFAHMPFLFNGLNAQYFNIRSRSLNSSLYWGFRIPAGFAFYAVVKPRHPNPEQLPMLRQCVARRLLPGLYVTFVWAAYCLILAYMLIFNAFGVLPPPQDSLDIVQDWRHSLMPAISFASFGSLDALVQSLMYNILAAKTGDHGHRAALCSGFYKTMQSLALGSFWLSDLLLSGSDQITYMKRYQIHWASMVALWIFAFPGTLVTLLQLRQMPVKKQGLGITQVI